MKDCPTAIFGSNDEIAAGVPAAAHSDGIQVPHELSIAGLEDSPFSKQSWPALTTARHATEEIGRLAAQRLITDLQRGANGEPINGTNEGFSPELVVRGSTGPSNTMPAAAEPTGQAAATQRLTLSVCLMKRATLSCSCFSDASCA